MHISHMAGVSEAWDTSRQTWYLQNETEPTATLLKVPLIVAMSSGPLADGITALTIATYLYRSNPKMQMCGIK